ncbi:RraA family protein [Lentibacillus salinarum]|uniref:Putative 4-hydroxy-4-methyl-2-oxoglutarate aldolase n=1 Tax=Lentibacillus salinarum TaxID=446820 RepID=A0ABW3ZT97_9BACI
MIKIGSDFPRVDNALIEGFKKTTPATVGHYLRTGFCDPGIKPVFRNAKCVGTAFTVQMMGEDIGAIKKAYELVQEGDVLVVSDADGSTYACAGEVSTFKSIRLGINGLVVDGAVTDCLEMEDMGFSCFAKYINALVGKPEGNQGAVRVPVKIGGVDVNPGDLVIADDNGIAFLYPEKAKEILPEMLQKEEEENILREEFWNEIGKPMPK